MEKFFTVYKITNLINNKIYIGVHVTSNINDDYMGSGKNIKNAINKYGIQNFKKEILNIFNNEEDMFYMESILVNEEFINDKNTYNIVLGGNGGWKYINDNNLNTVAETRDSSFYSKMGSWNDIEKRRKIWKLVPIKNRIKNAKKMGEKFGGQNKLTLDEINKRLKLIEDIDLTKIGWVKKVSDKLNITHAQTKRFIDKYYNKEFYRRKT